MSKGKTAPDKNSVITTITKNWAPQPHSGIQKGMALVIKRRTKKIRMAKITEAKKPIKYKGFVCKKKGGLSKTYKKVVSKMAKTKFRALLDMSRVSQ